jgi:hypothetical protein
MHSAIMPKFSGLKSPPPCSVQIAPKIRKEKNFKSFSFSVLFVTKKTFSMELSYAYRMGIK